MFSKIFNIIYLKLEKHSLYPETYVNILYIVYFLFFSISKQFAPIFSLKFQLKMQVRKEQIFI